MKKFFQFIVSLLITAPLFGQISSLQVNSPDSLAFYMVLKGQQVNEEARTSVKTDSLPAGDLPIDILLSDSVTHISSEIELAKGRAYVYEISKVGKEYMLLQFSVSPLESAEIEPSDKGMEEKALLMSDNDLSLDSLPAPIYEGPMGCSSPISPGAAQSFRRELEDAFFERKRVSSIDDFIGQNCVSVKQFASFIETIELEDYRLDLIRKHANDLFDQKNVVNLMDLLQLERSRELFREHVGD